MIKNMKLDSAIVKFCREHGIKGKQQHIVLQLLVEGMSGKEMDEFLGIRKGQSNQVLHVIYQKTNLDGRNILFSELYKTALSSSEDNFEFEEVFTQPVYDLYKGDKYLAGGTMQEISETTNVSINTLKPLRFEYHRNRASEGRNRLILIEV